jgi:two-component system NarL family response regulator
VLIADDHPVVREGLRAMLKTSGITVIGEARSGTEVIQRARELNPDVILMDVRMPDMDGIAATEAIKREAPSTSVIMITSFETRDYLRRAMEAGAGGYLIKGASRETLIQAVKVVKEGGSLVDADLLSQFFNSWEPASWSNSGSDDKAISSLTPRELQVLKLLAGGLTNKEIAQRMSYSVGTVKNVVQRIIEKLAVSDRTQAAVYAVRVGVDVP